jgi:dCMP deaminase
MTKPKASRPLRKQVVLYLPVIHRGYDQLFQTHADADEILLLGEGFIAMFPWLGKDIRSLSAQAAAGYIKTQKLKSAIRVIQPRDLPQAITARHIVLPDEDIMRLLANKHSWPTRHEVTYEPTFLRWDRHRSLAEQPVTADAVIPGHQLTVPWLTQATQQARQSSDWWRQVGAVAVAGQVMIAAGHNRHLPSAYTPYINGDPRANFSKGLHIELSSAMHAEAGLIARAAKDGVALAGAELYVTTFPCPNCARLIAEAGFARCFFIDDYAMLDGETILRQAGVKLVRVDIKTPSS